MAPWVAVQGPQGLIISLVSTFLPHVGRPDGEWAKALRDLDNALHQVQRYSDNILLVGDMNVADMYGSPQWQYQLAEMTEKDFDRKEQLLTTLETHLLHHLDQSIRRRPTHQGQAAHMQPTLLDYAFGTDRIRKMPFRMVATTAVLATPYQPLVATAWTDKMISEHTNILELST